MYPFNKRLANSRTLDRQETELSVLEIIASVDFANNVGKFETIEDNVSISTFNYTPEQVHFTAFGPITSLTVPDLNDGIKQLRTWINLLDFTFSPARGPAGEHRYLINKKYPDNILDVQLKFGNKVLIDFSYVHLTGILTSPARPAQTRTWPEVLLWLKKQEEIVQEIEKFL